LAQKYLPTDVWRWLNITTSYGTTVYDLVKSAIENPKSNVGIYVPGNVFIIIIIIISFINFIFILKLFLDCEAYDVFGELLNPVIGDYHKVDVATLKSVHDLGDANNLEDLKSEYVESIISTRVRVGRTVKGYPMASKLTRAVRKFYSYSVT
jgi:hypothetical protein